MLCHDDFQIGEYDKRVIIYFTAHVSKKTDLTSSAYAAMQIQSNVLRFTGVASMSRWLDVEAFELSPTIFTSQRERRPILSQVSCNLVSMDLSLSCTG